MTAIVNTSNRNLGLHRHPVSRSANKAGDWIETVLENFCPLLYDSRIVGGAIQDLIGAIVGQSDQLHASGLDSPPSNRAMQAAIDFVGVLPNWLATPEVTFEPEGDVSFEWYKDTDHLFSVICGEEGVLYYSGIMGPIERVSGKKLFRGSVPEEIINSLLELGFGKVAEQAA